MRLVWQRIQEGTGDPRLRELVARVMQQDSVPARDDVALARSLLRWVQRNIKYVREAPETYAAPSRTLSWKIGDCDDMTILICSTLRGVRIPCRAVFAGWDANRARRPTFKHVYPQAYVGGAWRTMEGVKAVPLGWDCADEKRSQGFRVRRGSIGDRAGA